MAVLFANNATATLASGITSGATALALTAGQGALFPTPANPDYFYTTLVDASNNIEIVKCTGRSGDNLTVVRAQQGTSARAYLAGDKCELRLTAGAMADIQAIPNNSIGAAQIIDGSVGTAEIANASVSTGKLIDASITAAKLAAGAVVGSIGFTPVKQGTSDNITLSWAGAGVLDLNVNGVDLGTILYEQAAAGSFSAGYRGYPGVVVSSSIPLLLAHAAHLLQVTAAGVVLTIPNDTLQAWSDGTRIKIANLSGGAITIVGGTSATLQWSKDATTGNRNLAPAGMCEIVRVSANLWFIEGAGLT